MGDVGWQNGGKGRNGGGGSDNANAMQNRPRIATFLFSPFNTGSQYREGKTQTEFKEPFLGGGGGNPAVANIWGRA